MPGRAFGIAARSLAVAAVIVSAAGQAVAGLFTFASAGTTEDGGRDSQPHSAHWESSGPDGSTSAPASATPTVDPDPFLRYDGLGFHLSTRASATENAPVGGSANAHVGWADFVNIELDAFSLLAQGDYLLTCLLPEVVSHMAGSLKAADPGRFDPTRSRASGSGARSQP